MRLAVLSDIHGNKYALERVLNDVRAQKVDKLLVLGDIVGYYYEPDVVLDMLSEWEFELIRGNHEIMLAQLIAGTISGADIKKKYGSGLHFAAERLTEQQISALTSAPDQVAVMVDGQRLLLCHGAPWDASFYLYPDTSKEILAKCDRGDIDFVFVGHSHYAFINRTGNTLVVNAGSVGQLRSMGGMASWVLFDTENGSIQMKMTPYEVEPLYRIAMDTDPEVAYLRNILKRH